MFSIVFHFFTLICCLFKATKRR